MALALRTSDAAAPPPRELVDTLGYLDGDYDVPANQTRVHRLIEEEMRRGGASAPALAPLPEPKLSAFVSRELERVAKGEGLAPMVVAPLAAGEVTEEEAGDVELLEAAVKRVRSEVEAQTWRQQELQILALGGVEAWLAFNKRNEDVNAVLEGVVKRRRTGLETVNQERKLAQDQVAPRLWALDVKRMETTQKNLQLEMANAMLRRDVLTLQREAVSRGIGLPGMPPDVEREMSGFLKEAAAEASGSAANGELSDSDDEDKSSEEGGGDAMEE